MNNIPVPIDPQPIPVAEKIIELEDEHAELNQVSRTSEIVKKLAIKPLFEAKNGKDLKKSFEIMIFFAA